MFYYFGRKARLAPLYPAPAYDLVIEPFAGSMAYTLHHRPLTAIGVEADWAVAATWERVAGMTAEALLAYPLPQVGMRTSDRWLMMAGGSHGTARASSYLWTERMNRDADKQRRLAARCVEYASAAVDYWLGSFLDAPDVEATWFIDPPYQKIERGYNGPPLDYSALADWSRTRRGQVIVCEQAGADWLPFAPLAEIRGTNNKRTTEVVWLSAGSTMDPPQPQETHR